VDLHFRSWRSQVESGRLDAHSSQARQGSRRTKTEILVSGCMRAIVA
jgi:hypothetical protein